jgi:CBS domain containing-hemolysin-like protein
MDTEIVYRLLLMLLIIGLNAFFAGAEAALVSVRPSRLRELADEGAVGAQAALSLLAKPERLLSVGQVGLTVASLALGWVGEETIYQLLLGLGGVGLAPALRVLIHGVALALAFALMTFTHVVLGEVVPKNIAIERPDRFALLVAPILLVIYRVTGPFVWAIERTAAWLSRLSGLRRSRHRAAHSPEEIKFVVATAQAAGLLSEFEKTSVENLLDLGSLAVREVMVPRDALTMAPADVSFEALLQKFSESRYSRIPIYEGEREHVLGIVHAKDMLAYARTREIATARRRPAAQFDARRFVREMPFVPETKPLDQFLDEMRGQHAIVTFVVDEYGTVAGMISADDVLEQVFGRIRDEFDPQAVAVEVDGPFEVEGTIPLRDLETDYGIELPVEAEYETLAGFLLYRLGRIPRMGDEVDFKNHRFQILRMEGNRIDEVRIHPDEAALPVQGILPLA